MLEDDPSLKLVVLEIGCGKRVQYRVDGLVHY
jgi:hypothetical protein